MRKAGATQLRGLSPQFACSPHASPRRVTLPGFPGLPVGVDRRPIHPFSEVTASEKEGCPVTHGLPRSPDTLHFPWPVRALGGGDIGAAPEPGVPTLLRYGEKGAALLCPVCSSWNIEIRLSDRDGLGECLACRATRSQHGSHVSHVKPGQRQPLGAAQTQRWARWDR